MDARGLDAKQLAVNAQCSEELVDKLMYAGYITHPNIATRIIRVLHFNAKRYNELVNERHRTNRVPMWVDAPTKIPGDLRKFLMYI